MHIAGKTNTPADTLSRPNGLEHQEPVKEVALIPQEAFLNLFEAGSDGSVEADIVKGQQKHWKTLEQWAKTLPIHQLDGVMCVERNAFVSVRACWCLHGHVCALAFAHAAAFHSISNTYRFAHHFSSAFST